MERKSAKHGPRLDEELDRETKSLQRGSPIESRVEEEREKEPPGEEDRDVDARTGTGAGLLGADLVEARRELARNLRPSVFPADRSALLESAREEGAPETVQRALELLPVDTRFATMGELWVALTEPELAKDPEALRSRAASDPLNEAEG